jgi:hypothetical protein
VAELPGTPALDFASLTASTDPGGKSGEVTAEAYSGYAGSTYFLTFPLAAANASTPEGYFVVQVEAEPFPALYPEVRRRTWRSLVRQFLSMPSRLKRGRRALSLK